MKNQEKFNVFTEKQVQAIKLIISKGFWGDTDMEFGKNIGCNNAHGFFTNQGMGKSFSGTMSGVSKTIDKLELTFIKSCSDWWGDGCGDMLFINMDEIGCTHDELIEWSTK